ncbi:DNA-dependent metalloprotease dvc-1-like [Culicoides brevitarsis]|uniref:DNA-dependent metalloprotease dvc-1-like n=1 Tax=Culicoides brevitarsis TaxID=469753 RepID=UPI00307C199B
MDDYALARKLQEEENQKNQDVQIISNKENYYPSNELNSTQNLVHPEWEIVDPTPNIHILKGQYDNKFFQGKLALVELEWSKVMYKCAGICYFKSNRFGRSIIIRLSEPLLKLRPRKDLVQTLLHEMIHAYLFVLNIREGNGGHGPNFKRIMENINRQAGTNITVYHTFHDEVNEYMKHWWRCDGPCRDRHPYFGYVKRCMNRAPGKHDFWFAEHQRNCGGKFVKIKEPTPKKKKNEKNEKKVKGTQSNKISGYIQTTKKGNPGTTMNRGSGTLVITKPPETKVIKKSPEKPVNSSNIRTFRSPIKPNPSKKPPNSMPSNIHGFNGAVTKVPTPSGSTFAGSGHTLGGTGRKRSRLLDEFEASSSKKPKTTTSEDPNSSILLDDDEDDVIRAVDLDDIERENDATLTQADKTNTRRTIIKQEIVDSLGFGDDDDIIVIDDDYDDDLAGVEDTNSDLNLSKEVIEDFFNDDMLGNDTKNVKKEMIPCPICEKEVSQSSQKEHIERCYEQLIEACQPGSKIPLPGSSKSSKSRESPKPSTSKAHIKEEIASPEVIVIPDVPKNDKIEVKKEENVDVVVINDDLVQCPACPKRVPMSEMNKHLDKCLENSFDDEF